MSDRHVVTVDASASGERLDRALAAALKHAKATQIVEIVQKIYGGRSLRVASDERTNVIILVAPEKQLKEVMKLIAELDEPKSDKK